MKNISTLFVLLALVATGCAEVKKGKADKKVVEVNISATELSVIEGDYQSQTGKLTIYENGQFALVNKDEVRWNRLPTQFQSGFDYYADCETARTGSLQVVQIGDKRFLKLKFYRSDLRSAKLQSRGNRVKSAYEVCSEFSRHLESLDEVLIEYNFYQQSIWLRSDGYYPVDQDSYFTWNAENQVFGNFFGRQDAVIDATEVMLPFISADYLGFEDSMSLHWGFNQLVVVDSSCQFRVRVDQVKIYYSCGKFYLSSEGQSIGVLPLPGSIKSKECHATKYKWISMRRGLGRPFTLQGTASVNLKSTDYIFNLAFKDSNDSYMARVTR